MIKLKRYINFLIDNNINQRQFLLLYCLYMAIEDKSVYQLMKEFTLKLGIEEEGKPRFATKADKLDLVAKGFINLKGNGSLSSHYELTEKITNLFITTYEAGQEFIYHYPSFTNIQGERIPLKKCDRNELRKLYSERINHSREEHNKVMLDLQYGKEQGLITMNIENFTRAEFWHSIREERTGNTPNQNNIVTNERDI